MRRNRLGGANKGLQDSLDRSEDVFFASYGVLGAIAGLGLAGYFLDRMLDTEPWLLVAGLLVGLALGLYGLVRSVRP